MPIVSFIPKGYQGGFKKIGALTDEEFQVLENSFSMLSLTGSNSQLADKISEANGLDVEDLKQILISVGSLISFLETEEMINDIIEEVATLAFENEPKLIEDKESFKKRLLFLLQNQHIYIASKAQDLTSEYPNLYLSSRISTDMRPIFGINIEDTPKCAIITHNLHIHYRSHQEADHKDIYIALEPNDVQMLIETLERAQAKEISLQTIFKKANIANLNE